MNASASTTQTTLSAAEKFLQDMFEEVPAMAGSGQTLTLRPTTNGQVWERQPDPCARIALVKLPNGRTSLHLGDTALCTDSSIPQRIYEASTELPAHNWWTIATGSNPDPQHTLDLPSLYEKIRELVADITTSPTPWAVYEHRRRQQHINRRARRAALRRAVRVRTRAARQI